MTSYFTATQNVRFISVDGRPPTSTPTSWVRASTSNGAGSSGWERIPTSTAPSGTPISPTFYYEQLL